MGRSSPVSPPVVRSRFLLEVASGLLRPGWLVDVRVVVGDRTTADEVPFSLSSVDTPAVIDQVVTGEVAVGIVNPSVLLALARNGVAPFRGPAPVSTLCVIPSPDELVVAARADSKVQSLEQMVADRLPVRLSLRRHAGASVSLVVDHLLAAMGASVADLTAWGGEVTFDKGLPARGDRITRAAEGGIDLIIDEATATWLPDACEAGMRVLALSEDTLNRLESWGYRRSTIRRERYPSLGEDVPTLDFSGFAAFVREDAPDDLVRSICSVIEERRDRIRLQADVPLDLADACGAAPGAPVCAPFHPAAEEHWRAHGYLA